MKQTVTSVASPSSANTDVIKSEGNADPNEYLDLYGDFDFVDDGKSGRSVATAGCTKTFSFFGSTCDKKAAAAPAPAAGGGFFGSWSTVNKKTQKVKKASSGFSFSSIIPGLSAFSAPAGPPAKPASNADAVFGTYYKGITIGSAPAIPIFIPDQYVNINNY